MCNTENAREGPRVPCDAQLCRGDYARLQSRQNGITPLVHLDTIEIYLDVGVRCHATSRLRNEIITDLEVGVSL